jgi:ABC-2 type transport system permease protein
MHEQPVSPNTLPRDEPTHRPRLRAAWFISRGALLVTAFAQIAFQTRLAYRSAYWVTLINMLVRLFAVGALWDALARSRPDALDVSREAIVTYGMLAVLLAQIFTWWDGPQVYIAERVRQGTITADLRLPIAFPFQMFAHSLGSSLAQAIGFLAPGYLFALLFFNLQLPVSAVAAGFFLASVALGYVLIFQLNFLIGLITFYTLRLVGIQHAYHGVISLLSGAVVPIWLFPDALQPLLNVLPFRGLFTTPLSIYIGQVSGEGLWAGIVHQGISIVCLAICIALSWKYTYRRIVIQGG